MIRQAVSTYLDTAESEPVNQALKNCADEISMRINACFTERTGSAPRLAEAMAYASLSGGKRIRGFLTIETTRLCNAAMAVPQDQSKLHEIAMTVAAAIELFHAYSLVHDDLPAMDDSNLRRGQPSTHIAYDDPTAILVGDALQSLAFELISDPELALPVERKIQLCSGLAQAGGGFCGMAAGQMLDMAGETTKPHLDDLKLLHALKTGALITFSARAGGLIVGAEPAALDAIKSYGACIGQVFQITDDLLDLTAHAETLGKPTGQDTESGKATYPLLMGEAEARHQAKKLTDQAIAALDCLPNSGHLPALALHILDRTY